MTEPFSTPDKSRFRYDDPPVGMKLNPGTWTNVRRDGVDTAKIACPGCQKIATLDPKDHQIDLSGGVHPSVECECGFHEFIRLLGWGEHS